LKYSIKIPPLAGLVLLAACHSSPTAPTPPSTQPPISQPPVVQPPAPPTPPAPVVPRISRTRYMAFGDSITAGTTSPAITLFRTMDAGLPQSYPFKFQSLLRARYTGQVIDVANEGRPGEAAADGVRRFPTVVRQVAPEVVILMHGINDITFLGMAGVRQVADYVDRMAKDARFAGAQVMICTLLPPRPGGFRAADPAVVDAYNRVLRDVARGEGAVLVDFQAQGFDVRYIGVDGLHPTDEGYTRMAEILFSQARALFEVAP
jgi:lysophospholipase L1-like esterase